MSATVQLIRPARLADAWRTYEVLLDGRAVGEVRNRTTVRASVAPGRHAVRARTLKPAAGRFGLSSPTMSFEVGDGETTRFTVHPPRYPEAALSWLKCVLIGPKDRWIEIDASDNVAS